MKTVQITVDDELLAAVDQAAEVGRESRSAFIRVGLQFEVKRRQNAKLEEVHRRNFQAQPDDDVWTPGVRAWDD